jgi:hypothetical protein
MLLYGWIVIGSVSIKYSMRGCLDEAENEGNEHGDGVPSEGRADGPLGSFQVSPKLSKYTYPAKQTYK